LFHGETEVDQVARQYSALMTVSASVIHVGVGVVIGAN